MCDSFEGFQPLSIARHEYHQGVERHLEGQQHVVASYDAVVSNLLRFDLCPDSRINLLKGWVKDTLHPDHCNIKNIALLRVDVDAYSATLEVLEYLYDKVVSGGFIIFDDSSTDNSLKIIENYNKIKIKLIKNKRRTKFGCFNQINA